MATNKLNQNQTNSNEDIILHKSSTSSSTTYYSPIINTSNVSSQRTVDLNIFPTTTKKTKWAIQRAIPVHAIDIPEVPFLLDEPSILDESIYYNRSSIHENNNITMDLDSTFTTQSTSSMNNSASDLHEQFHNVAINSKFNRKRKVSLPPTPIASIRTSSRQKTPNRFLNSGDYLTSETQNHEEKQQNPPLSSNLLMKKQKSSRNRRMNMQNSLQNQTSDLPSSVAIFYY